MVRFCPAMSVQHEENGTKMPTSAKEKGLKQPATRTLSRRGRESGNARLWGNRGKLRSCLDSQGPPKLEGIMWA